MIRVLIIEDEIIIARFIEQQLQRYFTCETFIAISEAEVNAVLPAVQPHLLLCDINLGVARTGIDLVNDLRKNYSFEVIFITSYQSRSIIEEAAKTNPLNYIIRPVDEMQFFAGVKLVMDKISTSLQEASIPLPTPLKVTDIQRQILTLIGKQKTTKEIASTLNLSPYTIKNHRHRICRNLNLKDENNALLKWVLENGNQLTTG